MNAERKNDRDWRWVIDTNILVSGMWTRGGNPWRVVDAIKSGRVTPVYCFEILAEYVDVLNRPCFPFDKSEVSRLVEAIMGSGFEVSPAPVTIGLPDKDDEIFVAAALEMDAPVIVTGNARHFPKRLCPSVEILTPTYAANRLELGG